MKPLRKPFTAIAAALAMLAVTIAGCGHRLVAPQGQTAVLIFPDRDTIAKFQQKIKEHQIMGAVGALGPSSKVTPLVNGTHIKVLSENGDVDEVIVTRGPYKGLHGYVLKSTVR
jgi:predicted small lipoprotein YifL